MLQLELSPEVEARIRAKADAQGVRPETYLKQLVEEVVSPVAATPTRRGETSDMEQFFREIARHSGKVPVLPDEATTREGICQDHD